MRNRSLFFLLLLVILSITIVPAHGWVISPNPSGEDNKYELFGPHVKGINIIVYGDTSDEWNAMQAGSLELEDWALDSSHVALWGTAGGPFTEANYGGEAGYFLLDINNNATYAANDAGPFIHNPTSELPLRQAIAYCVNRSDIVTLSGGSVLPVYTPVPSYMVGYINPDIAPGRALESLTYGGYTGNLSAANETLDANGYAIDANGWRIDPVSQGGNGAELNLIFYSRMTGLRRNYSDHLNAALNAVHIRTSYYHNDVRAYPPVIFLNEYFNLYISGWTAIGPDPDYLFDLYNGSNYYHPGLPPNYDGINYPDLNADLTAIKLATSFASGMTAALDAQVKFAQHCAAVPLWSATGVMDYKNTPVDADAASSGNWTNLVNQKGIGVNSWWATLNMHTSGSLYPNGYAYYGFSSTVTLQNIVYAQWFWDLEVLDRIYDGGAAREPITLSWVPQLYKSWTVGSWSDPSAGGATKTSVTITLRPDVYWQDGYPFTVADVYYTLLEISRDLLAKGFPPPSWYPTVQYMRSVEIIDDYNIQILLNINSVWAAEWVLSSIIIPKHIWKPIVDASISPTNNPLVESTTPDANIIGTGPFRWVSGVGDTVGSTIQLVANTPGSVVNGITSPGYYLYNPIYVDANPDNGLSKINIMRTAMSIVSNITITTRNLYQGGDLTGNKYVYVNDVLQSGYPKNETLAPMLPWNSTYMYPADPTGAVDVETLNLTLSKKSLTFVKVAVQITGPSSLSDGEANPWFGTWTNVTLPLWVTIDADIAGATLYDILGYGSYPTYIKNEAPAPDLKVDGRDLILASRAFGTFPGYPAWNSVCDVNNDYKVDGRDLIAMSRMFGY